MLGLTYILRLEGITGKELAKRLGITPSMVSQWENQVRPIPTKRLSQIKKIFPLYKSEYYNKQISTKEKLILLTAKKEQILQDSPQDKFTFFGIQKEIAKNKAHIDREQLFEDISDLLDWAYNIDSHLFLVVYKPFADLVLLEKKILVDLQTFKENNYG